MAKSKDKSKKKDKEKGDAADDERSYDVLVKRASVIAKPMAGKSLTKKIYKVVKRAHKGKHLCRGVKEVGKAIRKGAKGVCVFAGDISPIDVITHMPVMCEDAKIPYCYVPSKEDLGAAGQTKRPTSVVLVKDVKDIEGLDEVKTEVTSMAS